MSVSECYYYYFIKTIAKPTHESQARRVLFFINLYYFFVFWICACVGACTQLVSGKSLIFNSNERQQTLLGFTSITGRAVGRAVSVAVAVNASARTSTTIDRLTIVASQHSHSQRVARSDNNGCCVGL